MRKQFTPEQRLEESVRLEQKTSGLLYDICAEITTKTASVVSVQLMRDQDLQPIRGREENDYHAFFELVGGTVYHLRAYICHMLARRKAENTDPSADFDGIHLTAYRKAAIEKHGGTHALKQDIYPWNAEQIVEAIIEQNRDLFPQNRRIEHSSTGHLWHQKSDDITGATLPPRDSR